MNIIYTLVWMEHQRYITTVLKVLLWHFSLEIHLTFQQQQTEENKQIRPTSWFWGGGAGSLRSAHRKQEVCGEEMHFPGSRVTINNNNDKKQTQNDKRKYKMITLQFPDIVTVIILIRRSFCIAVLDIKNVLNWESNTGVKYG